MKCTACEHELIDHYRMLHHCPQCGAVYQSRIDFLAGTVTLHPRYDLKPSDCGGCLPSVRSMVIKEE